MSHVILHGDCLELLHTLEDESVDLVITDPPFNIGKKYNIYQDQRDDYTSWCETWLEECVRTLKPGGALYLINYPENNALLLPYLDSVMTFRRWLVWNFPAWVTSPSNYTRSHYSILYHTKGEPAMFNREDILEPYKALSNSRIKRLIKKGFNLSNLTGRTPWDVFEHDIVRGGSKENTEHPCQIPEDLLEMFIRASSNEGDVVLDPFSGSFSTGVTAKKCGRASINIEMDEHYCEIGRKRLAKTTPTATLKGLFA